MGAGLFALALGGAAAAGDVPAYVKQAIADPARPKADRDADAPRDPGATIAFAGIKPGMTIAELYPCGGYFSRLLSDVVGPKGKVYGLEATRWMDCVAADRNVLTGLPVRNMTLDAIPIGTVKLPQTVDLIWITQNYHDLHVKAFGPVDLAAFNREAFAALKPGGIFFVLDHTARPGLGEDDIGRLHRIPKDQIVREVTAAGFRLAGESHILPRPNDDLSKPIFDPAVRFHTDQYALIFVKP
ncbi:MAG TPA: hypothetical protein VGB91_07080 [Rhizomicrobium sp.]